MKSKITIGTRGSQLARWQTDYIAALLSQSHPDLEIEITVITTKGDRVLDTPLPLIGGKGLFTAELEAALRSGEIDFAVHSLKDLPTEDPEGLIVGAIPERANPADVLVSRENYTLDSLPDGAVIGTSSHRRAAQLKHLCADITTRDIRGNIDTRIRKALDPDEGYDAIVLAHAGLSRLKLDNHISQVLKPEQMLCAPGQGALGVQCRDDDESRQLLVSVHHFETALCVAAERGFLSGLGGGCSVPVAAYAVKQPDEQYKLIGRVCSIDGLELIEVETQFTANDIATAKQAGSDLAQQAITQGANQILETRQ